MPTIIENISIPTYDELMNPVLKAIKDLGGSGTNQEIYQKVVENEKYSEEQLSVLQSQGRSTKSKIEYRSEWAKWYLKEDGYLEITKRGVWSLTSKGKDTNAVDEDEVRRNVNEKHRQRRDNEEELPLSETDGEDEIIEMAWKEELRKILINLAPDAFERLMQRILREAGFIEVEVTGRSGDCGIDGRGILRINDFFNFRVVFQCKKYNTPVTPDKIRDFRGSFIGRADKGLFVTTSSFTKAASEEAYRDGAPAIDLIDGDQLIEKLKELSLGVETKEKIVEDVIINKEWFNSL